ncbi:hypothetical protein HYY75_12800, partial [bacterium]|nr:hypothetical protein [bacterium]
MSFELFEIKKIKETLSELSDRMEKKLTLSAKSLADKRPDLHEIHKLSTQALLYYKLLKSLNFSWTNLFENLEGVLPEGVRLVRVRIRPESSTRLSIEGEALQVQPLTDFLKRLFESKHFSHPRLRQHFLLDP